MEKELDIKKSWIEASVAELGRCLPGMVILISQSEVEDVQTVFHRILSDTWEEAQRPLINALMDKLRV